MSSKLRLYFRVEGALEASRVELLRSVNGGAPSKVGSVQARMLNGASVIWSDFVEVDFKFEARQPFMADVLNYGRANFNLGHVVSARNATLSVPVSNPSHEFTLFISAVAVDAYEYDDVALTFGARDLQALNPFSDGSDTFIKLYRALPNGLKECLFTSALVKNAVHPTWQTTALLNATQLIGRNANDPCLVVEVWYNGVFSDKLMGCATFSLGELYASRGQRSRSSWTLVKPHKLGQQPGKYGCVQCAITTLQHRPRFTELLSDGLNINVAVSIDFTSSNGDPHSRDSLHFMDPTRPNASNSYSRAMQSVCDVLLEYDNDKLVPAFGFGAQLPNGQTSHCFHLNALPDPNVYGVEGILAAYQSALRSVKLSGPTNFAPSIRQAEAAARQTPNTYTVLLILTDGCITDTDDTIDAIVACGDAPLSIVIVGVGSADFTTMDVLDGDDERLTSSRGVRCLRDLVQFVPYRDFATAPREVLAAEVLEEVPRQVEEWAVINRITLRPSMSDVV